MADSKQNLTQSGDNSTPQKKALSPWDEDLPEEPKKNNIIGSLDPSPADLNRSNNAKPVPFNIPSDVGDEKVGKKIPAEKVINQPPATIQQSNPEPKPIPAQPKQKPMPVQAVPTPIVPPKSEPLIKPQPQTVAPESVSGEPKATNTKNVGGVSELISPKNEVLPANQPQAPNQNKVVAKTEKVPITPVAKPTEPIKKEPVAVPISPAPVSKLKPESSALSDIKPKVEEKPAPILPDISKTSQIAKPAVASNKTVPIEIKNPENPSKPTKEHDQSKDFFKPVAAEKVPFFKKPKFFIPAILLFLFVLGVYLTEAGIIGIGLENIYGITGIESLWGGLPRNPEKALGKSAVAMQQQLNFKIKGTVSMTVNKTIKSPITSPLVSVTNLPFAFKDSNAVAGASALLSQYDYYGTDSSSSSTSTTTSNPSSSTSTSSGTSSATTTTDTTQILGDQGSQSAYQAEESTIKQVDLDVSGISSNQAIETDFILKKLVGSSSSVNVVSTKNQLFVKSSPDIQFATNAQENKWLEFNISTPQNENPFRDLANIKLDQGFSIIGRRSGNEKVGNVRCFKYTIDNLEIGDSLDFLGIKKDMVQKIEGNIWIGVADHYLHKVDLKIIPSISSSISQMTVTLELYDYGVENSIIIPALQDKIVANVSVNPQATGTSTTTTTTTTTPSVTSAVTMGERDQTRKSDLQNIKAALEKYKQTNGRYPVASNMIHLNAKDNVMQKALVPEYISSLPEDPKASDGWFYGYESNGRTFKLSARLENSADPQVTNVGNNVYLHWVYNN